MHDDGAVEDLRHHCFHLSNLNANNLCGRLFSSYSVLSTICCICAHMMYDLWCQSSASQHQCPSPSSVTTFICRVHCPDELTFANHIPSVNHQTKTNTERSRRPWDTLCHCQHHHRRVNLLTTSDPVGGGVASSDSRSLSR